MPLLMLLSHFYKPRAIRTMAHKRKEKVMINTTKAQRMHYARQYAKSDNAFVKKLNKYINGRQAFVIVSKNGKVLTRTFNDDAPELAYGRIDELYL